MKKDEEKQPRNCVDYVMLTTPTVTHKDTGILKKREWQRIIKCATIQTREINTVKTTTNLQ
jgi:hypothetical protein